MDGALDFLAPPRRPHDAALAAECAGRARATDFGLYNAVLPASDMCMGANAAPRKTPNSLHFRKKRWLARKLSLHAARYTPRIDAFETPAPGRNGWGLFFCLQPRRRSACRCGARCRDSGSIARGALALLGSGARANLFTRRAARPAPAAGGDHARIARLFLPGSRGPWLERRRFPPTIPRLSSQNFRSFLRQFQRRRSIRRFGRPAAVFWAKRRRFVSRPFALASGRSVNPRSGKAAPLRTRSLETGGVSCAHS